VIHYLDLVDYRLIAEAATVTDSLRLPVAAVVIQVFGGGRIVSDGLVFRALAA